jgi:hypothetical protein
MVSRCSFGQYLAKIYVRCRYFCSRVGPGLLRYHFVKEAHSHHDGLRLSNIARSKSARWFDLITACFEFQIVHAMVDALIRALYWYSSNSISSRCCTHLLPLYLSESFIFALVKHLVLHSTPPLHLSMELQPHPNLTLVHILPIKLAIPALENLPVHARARLAQNSRPPLAVLHSRELHAATHGLGDAELAAEQTHFHRVLLLLPGTEARFERVCGRCAGCTGGFGSWRGEVQVVAEGVVNAWGGRGAEDGGRAVGGGCGGDDAERLRGGRVSWVVVVRVGERMCVPL